jgi:hypothetical protein
MDLANMVLLLRHNLIIRLGQYLITCHVLFATLSSSTRLFFQVEWVLSMLFSIVRDIAIDVEIQVVVINQEKTLERSKIWLFLTSKQ